MGSFFKKNKDNSIKFQTVDKLEEKRVCLQFFYLMCVPVVFRNPLPYRRMPAKPPRRKLLWYLASQLFGWSVANFFNLAPEGFIPYKTIGKIVNGIETIPNPVLSTT
ncbi:hypothetical protein [Peribacillus simplex]|uniref:hypothetical protein n=1 Tax=Peribacillus simplex TaxID=1478 RepID=UPI003D267585